jgi:MbtH protein
MSSEIEYFVVVNHEEQYSIWPTFKEIPLGWRKAGKSGAKQECLDYIDEVWTDITPKSVRDAIAAARLQQANA